MSKKNWILLVLVLVFALFVVACGEENTEVPLDLGEPTAIATIDGESVQNALNNRPEAETAEAEAMPAATATPVVERIEVEVEATRIVEVPVEVEVEVPVEGQFFAQQVEAALADANDLSRIIPGLVIFDATGPKPETWDAFNNETCGPWGLPRVVDGTSPDAMNAETQGTLSLCWAEEILPGNTITRTITMESFEYFESGLATEDELAAAAEGQELPPNAVHSTHFAAIYNWEVPVGYFPIHDGYAAWASAGVGLRVKYADGEWCSGGSFEIVPDVPMTYSITVPSGGSVSGYVGYGPWGVFTDKGLRAPDCRPDPELLNGNLVWAYEDALRTDFCEDVRDDGWKDYLIDDADAIVEFCGERGIVLNPPVTEAETSDVASNDGEQTKPKVTQFRLTNATHGVVSTIKDKTCIVFSTPFFLLSRKSQA